MLLEKSYYLLPRKNIFGLVKIFELDKKLTQKISQTLEYINSINFEEYKSYKRETALNTVSSIHKKTFF